MLSFSSNNTDIAVQKQAPTLYAIDYPLSEHEPTLAQLRAILPRSVKVRVDETANGITTWQFTGAFI